VQPIPARGDVDAPVGAETCAPHSCYEAGHRPAVFLSRHPLAYVYRPVLCWASNNL